MAKLRNVCVAVAAAALAMGALAGCPTQPRTAAGQANLSTDVDATMTKLFQRDDSLRGVLDNSAGYAVFPSIGEAAFILGGAYGKGQLFEKGQRLGFCDVTQGSAGFQGGAQTFSEVIVFQSQKAVDDFKAGNFSFSAQASVVALKPGAARTANFQNGVAVFVHTQGGLMAKLSLAGQKFRYQAGTGEMPPPSSDMRPSTDMRRESGPDMRRDPGTDLPPATRSTAP